MKTLLLIPAIAIAFCLVSCEQNMTADNSAESKEERNKEAALAIMKAFEENKPEALDTLIAEDAKEHTPDPSMGITSTGRQMVKDVLASIKSGYPDYKNEVKHVAADGDMVMVYFTMKGTNSGPMGNMPATNKTIEVDGVDIMKFNDKGMATDHWGVYDNMKMMEQLGLMPPMGGGEHMAGSDTTQSEMNQ